MTNQQSHGERASHTLSDRIREVADAFASRADAAKAAGVSPQQLHNWMSARNEPPLLAIAKMAQARGFNLAWVATGAGAPRYSSRPTAASTAPSTLDFEIRLADVTREVQTLRGALDNLAHAKELGVLRALGEAVSDYFLAKELFLTATDDAARCAAHLDRTTAKNLCVRRLQEWRRVVPVAGGSR